MFCNEVYCAVYMSGAINTSPGRYANYIITIWSKTQCVSVICHLARSLKTLTICISADNFNSYLPHLAAPSVAATTISVQIPGDHYSFSERNEIQSPLTEMVEVIFARERNDRDCTHL